MLKLIFCFFETIKKVNAVCFFNAAESWQLELRDPASPIFEGMIFFHNYLVFFLILIGSLVFWLLYITIAYFNTFVNFNKSQIFTHSSILEIVWTILPAIVLLIIAAPSLPKNLDVILFFIAAVCGLINSAYCDPDMDETFNTETPTWLIIFKNFITEGYSSMGEFTNSQELIAFLIFVLIVVFIFIVGCYRTANKKTTERLKLFQTFCCNNQEAIFLVTMGVIFILNINKLSVCEVLIGSVIMGYGFLMCLLANQLKIPLFEVYLFTSFLTRVGCNTLPWDYIFGGLLLLYVYSVLVMLFPGLDLENTLSKLNSGQKNVTVHMLTEFKYFYSLEMLILLYWGFKLVSPAFFKILFGDFEYLLTPFVHYCFLSCIIARIIATNIFNPFGDRKLTMIGTGAGLVSAFFSYKYLRLGVVDNAIGGTQEPAKGQETTNIQVAHLGWSSTTKKGLELGKAWMEVYGGTPPAAYWRVHPNKYTGNPASNAGGN